MPESTPTPYVYLAYPAWRFHPTLPAKMVDDAAADAALGPEWVDTPAKLSAPAAKPAKPAPEVLVSAPPAPVAPAPVVPDPPGLETEIPADDPKPKPKPRAK